MKQIISAVIIAAGLFLLGLSVKWGMNSFVDDKRTVSVRGLCEREVKANKVIWPISYVVLGNDLQDLYKQVEANNQKIINMLTSNGLSRDDCNIGAPAVTDQNANSYSPNNSPYRYSVTTTITLATDQVDLAREIMQKQGELLKQGIAITENNWQTQIIYEYTDLNSIKPDMIAEATRNARQAAEKFAEDSGSKVGKIKDAQQGQFSIEDRDPYTPYIKNVRVVTYVNYYIKD